MTSILNPYVAFPGNARSAMEFYAEVFGGELAVNTFGEFGSTEPELVDLLMHARLDTPLGFTLMASDAVGEHATSGEGSISLSISGDDEAALRGYWEKLSEGGSIELPLDKQAWGDTFGMCNDRFGLRWMVNITAAD